MKLNIILLTFLSFAISCNSNRSSLSKSSEIYDLEVFKKDSGDLINYSESNNNTEAQDSIKALVKIFNEKNIEKIAKKIQYPLKREYPIPSIKNETEFKKRFTEIFDDYLIDLISTSTLDNWYEVGWRGYTIENGIVWIANYDGVISSINYQSQFEKNFRENLIKKDKESIHSSINEYKAPILKFITNNYMIRIDELYDSQFRYSSWKIPAKESSQPDLVLENGKYGAGGGSGGNHSYIFEQDDFVYEVHRNLIGEDDSAEVSIVVEKNGQVMLSEDGILIH